MAYKLQELSAVQLALVPNDIRKEIDALQADSENYADDLYEVFEENDKLLYDLAIAKIGSSTPPPPPAPAPKPKASVKPEKTQTEKDAFAKKMQDAKAAKAAESKKNEKPTPSVKEAMFSVGDYVTLKDGEFEGDRYKVNALELDGDTYLYALEGEVPLKNISEGRLKSIVAKPMTRTTQDKPFNQGEWVMWHGTPAVVSSMKPRGESYEYELFDGHKNQRAYHGDLEVMDGQLEYLGEVRIGCDMKAYRNTSGKKMTVNNINGNLIVAPNDVILYLPQNNHSFTNIKDEMFYQRCIIIKESTISEPVPLTDAKVIKMVSDSKEVVPEAKAAKKEQKEQKKAKKATKVLPDLPPDISASVTTKTKEMIVDGCNVAEFTKVTKGTPIHDFLLGEVAEFNSGATKDRVNRIGIDKKGRYIAEVINTGGVFTTNYEYYLICPERGIKTALKEEAKELHKAFKEKAFRIQFSIDTVKRIYNRGESFEACNELAIEAYRDLDKEAYVKFRKKCLNPKLLEYYNKQNSFVHEAARRLRKKDPSLSHHEAAKQIRSSMRSSYRLFNLKIRKAA
jgi:hypothetical protein